MATQTTGGGSTTSFSNTPQAKDDVFTSGLTAGVVSISLTEDNLQPVFFDVMANDLGGNAKTLFSVDNGINNSGAINGYSAADLLTQDTARAEATSGDTSLNGAKIWITADGKVGYDAASLSAAFKAQLQALHAGEMLTDTFTYAIRLANGTLSWATVTVQYGGASDNASVAAVSDGDYAVVEKGGVNNGTPGDASAAGQLSVSDVDTGEAKFQSPASLNGTYGTFTFNANTGQWTYALDDTRNATQGLTAGQHVTDKLTVTSFDGTASYDIIVNVTGANDNASIA